MYHQHIPTSDHVFQVSLVFSFLPKHAEIERRDRVKSIVFFLQNFILTVYQAVFIINKTLCMVIHFSFCFSLSLVYFLGDNSQPYNAKANYIQHSSFPWQQFILFCAPKDQNWTP
jgi:hypothetical protein